MGNEETVGIEDENRDTHVLTIGPTDSGKTQVMVHSALQDIEKGHGVCLIVLKGDAIDQVLRKMPEDRHEDVIYLNPNEDPVTKINPLEPHLSPELSRAQRENQKEIIVSDLVDLFKRYSKEWGDRFPRVLKTLLRAHLDLNIEYEESYTLLDVYNCVVDEEALRSLIDRTDNEVIRNQLIRIKERLSQYDMDPLQQRLDDFVMNDTVQRVIDTEESAVDFREVVNNGKILLVDVQKGSIGKEAAELIGSIVITKIWAAAQSRIGIPAKERRPHYLYVDEVHNFAGEGSNFAKILAEAREYRLGVWLASQYLNQLEPKMRQAVANNCRTKVFFNPAGSEDLAQIAGMLKGVKKRDLTALSRYQAVMQQPGCSTVTFRTFQPWEGAMGNDELQRLKLEATVAIEEEEGETERQHKVRRKLGRGKNAGDWKHQRLLEQAKGYLEKRPEVVQVNLLYQDPGEERADGEVIKSNGVANLEAEMSTLEKPAKVLRNYRRAVQQDRKCIFVVEDGFGDYLERIITDPVNRLGDTYEDEQGSFDYYQVDGEPFDDVEPLLEGEYRILTVTNRGTVLDHGREREAECPELDPPEMTIDNLEAFCPYREGDGNCSLLEQPCVLH